jgi:cytochrome c-type biogenesis protein CcmE
MNGKLGALVAVGIAAAGVGVVSFGNLGKNLVYYWSPSEMAQHADTAVGATIRLGGMVEAGTMKQEGSVLRFRVTDGKSDVAVTSTGVPPQMFREGIGVVVEGTLGKDGIFQSSRMMVKHDNEYKAPVAGQTPDTQTLMKSLDEG